MECPKCRGKIIDNCCIRCGSMINGAVISLNDKKDKNEDIKIYQKNFDTMLRNNNWYISFLIMSPQAYIPFILVSILSLTIM